MTNFMKSVDERTNLAGTNRLELLLFSLGVDSQTGREEVFGINVFKVREVMSIPEITQAPDMPPAVEGMISLRGQLIPVVNLTKFCDLQMDTPPEIMIVTEYNNAMQGYMVYSVDTILRLDWNKVKTPPEMLSESMGGVVTAVTELEDGRIVMIMDVEKVLADTTQDESKDRWFSEVTASEAREVTVFFADDSLVARKQIERTLDHMGFTHVSANNGLEAWEKLKEIADRADSANQPVKHFIQLILTDVEMPEMDGFVLTKKIKSDSRFNGIPVIMHSSLSSDSNQNLGINVGANDYVPKFDPTNLSEVLEKNLAQNDPQKQLNDHS
ncbi:MAG: chemotaxis protein [gamma proteobacterium symbiont of Bathyaustriella thionipta]|nr:chemotaxis protein [gamma proteobacterium symbiont of Bathyaustriella thionipta]MCU7949805.1 chemotaxis protein [gamma proteobacterium symbiont of Bathyaustriella thionipta]MCU7951834.1 chemotaxis protein [gamma proteobacterium symbiont of Bathyaustriella thionipta]MCU7956396.1 chemotaxis protein [gamma proteobacterium symbiont of Bathyaustriella thionipta]MCU7968906.1 chemotaxis protein [gamma proteobacterium symbiont of Bathyaustriella thionipta]